MENLETIKKSLPGGYEKTIADNLGCSVGTVHNVLNGKNTNRSSWKMKVLTEATRLANECANTLKAANQVADELNQLHNGTAS
ncbi:MAG: hypothetical protein ACRCUJ_07785 [Phocaeicola sp.]